jgi:transposase InsO family protein
MRPSRKLLGGPPTGLHAGSAAMLAANRGAATRIVGHLRTSLVADALANAAAARDPAPGVIFHSDRGYQAVRLS